MCRFASFVLTRDREFWLPESDSHEQIIAANALHADGARGPNVLRVEITPGKTVTRWTDYASWDYRVDQDILPDWADPIRDEARARAALERRAASGFTRVDAPGCSALTTLDAPQATRVDVSGCSALTTLDAPQATSVDVSGCSALTTLDAPQATYVDVSGCSALTRRKRKRGCVYVR